MATRTTFGFNDDDPNFWMGKMIAELGFSSMRALWSSSYLIGILARQMSGKEAVRGAGRKTGKPSRAQVIQLCTVKDPDKSKSKWIMIRRPGAYARLRDKILLQQGIQSNRLFHSNLERNQSRRLLCGRLNAPYGVPSRYGPLQYRQTCSYHMAQLSKLRRPG